MMVQKDLIVTQKENAGVKNTSVEINVKCVPKLTRIIQNVTNAQPIITVMRLVWIV